MLFKVFTIVAVVYAWKMNKLKTENGDNHIQASDDKAANAKKLN